MKAKQICWFEIPVFDLDRAIHFYSTVLSVKIEKIKLLNKYYGVFNKDTHLVGGALVVKENFIPGNGTVLFFCVIDLSEVFKKVNELNGKIIIPKTLMTQTNSEGDRILANNLIDENIGYYAEIADCEGNHIGLYSNS